DQPRLVEPDGLHRTALVEHRRGLDREATPAAPARDPAHLRNHAHVLVRYESGDRAYVTAVLVAEGEVLDQVAHGLKSQRLGGLGRAHRLDLERLVEQRRRRAVRWLRL